MSRHRTADIRSSRGSDVIYQTSSRRPVVGGRQRRSVAVVAVSVDVTDALIDVRRYKLPASESSSRLVASEVTLQPSPSHRHHWRPLRRQAWRRLHHERHLPPRRPVNASTRPRPAALRLAALLVDPVTPCVWRPAAPYRESITFNP